MSLFLVFDCYGTLIDWQGGLKRAFREVVERELEDEFLRLWMERDMENVRRGGRSYRDILIDNTSHALNLMGISLTEEDFHSLALSIYKWEPFEDVPEGLRMLRAVGFKLFIMSNTDPEFLSVSASKLGVEFDGLVACSTLGYYKPDIRAWEEAMRRFSIPKEYWVQVSAYPEYDLLPARELGLRTVLVNRYDKSFNADLIVGKLLELAYALR